MGDIIKINKLDILVRHTKSVLFSKYSFPNNSIVKDRRALKFCQVVSFGIHCNTLSLVWLLKSEKQTVYVDKNDLQYFFSIPIWV